MDEKEKKLFDNWFKGINKELEAYTPELLVSTIEIASQILHTKISELRKKANSKGVKK